MIQKTEQKQLKTILGAHYAEDVFDILKEAGITNKNGVSHNPEYIRKVFQGQRENMDVERAIYTLGQRKKEEAEAIKK